MTSPPFLFLIIMILISSQPATASEAGGIFDIMDETMYAGNWSEIESEYNAPPSSGCFMNGRMFVINQVSTRFKKGDWKSTIYAEEYHAGVMDDRGRYGETLGRTRGAFADSISGSCSCISFLLVRCLTPSSMRFFDHALNFISLAPYSQNEFHNYNKPRQTTLPRLFHMVVHQGRVLGICNQRPLKVPLWNRI